MVDKSFCMSSYLAFRYIEREGVEFAEGLTHQSYHRKANHDVLVKSVPEIDLALRNVFHLLQNERLGVLLSGGMDSAVLASYMPRGSNAYTFRFLGGEFQKDELIRAEYYAQYNKLNLHYVDIDWSSVESCVDLVMQAKDAPVHSIEPQICFAAQQMKRDGISLAVIGDGSDYVFGGMDGLLSKDWSYDEYVRRVVYIDPRNVLKDPSDIGEVFERYRVGPSSIDFLRFYDEIVTDESYASYENAFRAAELGYVDPYEHLKLSVPLDLDRIRSGESKYLIRELFAERYPGVPIPEKLPMPRPVDEYFKNWAGVRRPEFKTDIDYSKLTGNQKWQLWCLERFLDNLDRR